MASSTTRSSFSMAVLSSACVLVLISGSASAQLSFDYYSTSCPVLFPTVRLIVRAAIAREARMGASLLRLFFHDCFVNVNFNSHPISLSKKSFNTHYRNSALVLLVCVYVIRVCASCNMVYNQFNWCNSFYEPILCNPFTVNHIAQAILLELSYQCNHLARQLD